MTDADENRRNESPRFLCGDNFQQASAIGEDRPSRGKYLSSDERGPFDRAGGARSRTVCTYLFYARKERSCFIQTFVNQLWTVESRHSPRKNLKLGNKQKVLFLMKMRNAARLGI